MQSTGHTAMHSSQPVQCCSITVCIVLLLPKIASVGHTGKQSVQPMHQASSITATALGDSKPLAGFRLIAGCPVMVASRAMPAAPPGGLVPGAAAARRPADRAGGCPGGGRGARPDAPVGGGGDAGRAHAGRRCRAGVRSHYRGGHDARWPVTVAPLHGSVPRGTAAGRRRSTWNTAVRRTHR